MCMVIKNIDNYGRTEMAHKTDTVFMYDVIILHIPRYVSFWTLLAFNRVTTTTMMTTQGASNTLQTLLTDGILDLEVFTLKNKIDKKYASL